MRNLHEIYKDIEKAGDFSGISIENPNQIGLCSNRPLHVVAVWGDCEAIKLLVDAGASINAVGEHCFTPLHEAANQGHWDAVKLFISLGSRSVPCDAGQLPSGWAADEALAKFLIENGF